MCSLHAWKRIALPKPEVILLGSGPSIRSFDCNRLRGNQVIAINDACRRATFAQAVFSADRKWIRRNRHDLNWFKGRRLFAVGEEFLRDSSAFYFERIRALGFSANCAELHVAGCSGYAALNLAYLLGFSKIYLLGFDLNSPPKHYLEWAEAFDSVVPDLIEAGIQVLNANSNSAITSFPRCNIDELDIFRRSQQQFAGPSPLSDW